MILSRRYLYNFHFRRCVVGEKIFGVDIDVIVGVVCVGVFCIYFIISSIFVTISVIHTTKIIKIITTITITAIQFRIIIIVIVNIVVFFKKNYSLRIWRPMPPLEYFCGYIFISIVGVIMIVIKVGAVVVGGIVIVVDEVV